MSRITSKTVLLVSVFITFFSFRFFQSLDWDDVYNKQLKPPIVPKITSKEDTSNFEDYTDEESKTSLPVSKKQLRMFEDF